MPCLAVGAVAAVAVFGTTAPAAVADDSSTQAVDAGSVEVIEPDPVDLVPEDLAGTAGHAAWLVETYPQDFGGSWYDEARGLVVVQVVSSQGREIATEMLPMGSIDITEVQFSAKDLEDQIQAIATDPNLAPIVNVASADYENNSVRVDMESMSASSAEDLDASGDIDIEVDITDALNVVKTDTRDDDSGPGHAGGMRYYARKPDTQDWGSCTAGWSWQWAGGDYMLTAGHCFPQHTDRTQAWTKLGGDWDERFGGWPGYTSVNDSGYDSIKFSDDEYHGDVSLISMTGSNNANANMWTGGVASSDKLDVTQWSAPFVGQGLCVSGAYTGKTCGFVVSRTNTHIHLDAAPSRWDSWESVDVALHGNDCLAHGDSGGSVYDPIAGTNNVRAVGVVNSATTSGSCGDAALVFTGTEEAGQAFGGAVKTQ